MSVLDLQINVRRSYQDIYPYRLSCDTACPLTGQPTYLWYRNNQRVGFGQMLNLRTVTSGDKYTCSVSGSHVSSPAVCEFGTLLLLFALLQTHLPLQRDEIRKISYIF